MIYLDYASNTPVSDRVLEVFMNTEKNFMANPNSTHPEGIRAKAELDRITASIAEILGVQPAEIIYTSGASEANNMAIKGIARANRHKGKHIISTGLEHSSVSGALQSLQEQGWEIELLDILPDGTVDLDHLKDILRPDTVLVSVGWADSELGTIQPIKEIHEIVRAFDGCVFHTDGVQAVGKTAVNLAYADLITIAPHKFFGLNGCGILVKKEGIVLEPLIHGGGSTTIYRSGTPALALCASIEAALKETFDCFEDRLKKVEEIRKYLEQALRKYPLVGINSTGKGVPHILNISVKGIKGDVFQAKLSECNICVSVKSACAVPGTPSKSVYAVTKDRKNALASWRISLSHLTRKEEIDDFLIAFDEIYKELT